MIGDRVGAVQSADEKEVRLFGYGIYEGDMPHPVMKMSNPKIRLDDGRVVWGCECWWGPEKQIKEFIGDKKVTIVKLEESDV